MSAYKPTAAERKKYVFDEERDYSILETCKKLEKEKLTKADRELVELIKTQLVDDWRAELIKKLKQIVKKYK